MGTLYSKVDLIGEVLSC